MKGPGWELLRRARKPKTKPASMSIPRDRWRLQVHIDVPLHLELGELTGLLSRDALKYGCFVTFVTGECTHTADGAPVKKGES